MLVLKTISDARAWRDTVRQEQKSTGFVPTMGALHPGHISLIRKANIENDVVVASIFVNPIQFNNREDLDNYPRTLDADIRRLEEVACDVLFAPAAAEMYPDQNIVNDKYNFGHLDKILEGKYRPGHFNGVAVVVRKLFEIIQPDRAYFGLKDYQQLKIVEALVKYHKMPVEIIACPTLRERDGLAMSSRNVRLTHHERSIAPVIHRVLLEIKDKMDHLTPKGAQIWGVNQLNKYAEIQVEYLQIVGADDLLPIETWTDKKSVAVLVAAYLGKVRLIDNVIIK
ncbi:MAG: pantoate--beta-alanine ligase [Clostridia bacterium]|nr:pantoate--beta-alanine ligase [Clostridia bacterium]